MYRSDSHPVTADDLSHLERDRVGIGCQGVFAGDWAWRPHPDTGAMTVPTGYVCTLIDLWNGWAVFTCHRDVAEAIVADQHTDRDAFRATLHDRGMRGIDLDQAVDHVFAHLYFDGDDIVHDARNLTGDPNDLHRYTAAADGSYIIAGWSWCWDTVAPQHCDRIAGDLPTAANQRRCIERAATPKA